VNKGEEIEVVILAVDFENRRITLGHKQIEENPWEKYAVEYADGNEVEATVDHFTDKGLFAKLPLGVEAFLPKEEAEFEGDDLKEAFSEGDTFKAFVFEFDENNKNITLSQKNKGKTKKETAEKPKKKSSKKSKKSAKKATGALTLGEMSGLEDLKRKLEEKEGTDNDE